MGRILVFSDKATFHLSENSRKKQLSIFDQLCLKSCQFLKKFTMSYCNCGYWNCPLCSCPTCKFAKYNCICNLWIKKIWQWPLYHIVASPKTLNSFATNASLNIIFFLLKLSETCEEKLAMSFQSYLFDKLSIVLLSSSILVALDYLSEASSIIITYDSDKYYVYALNATNSLIIG